MQIKLGMIKNVKDIRNSEADLWMSGKNPPGKKLPGKLLPRKMSPENCPATLLKKRHRCFPVNFEKFLIIHFLQNTSGRLLLHCFFFFYQKLNMHQITSIV